MKLDINNIDSPIISNLLKWRRTKGGPSHRTHVDDLSQVADVLALRVDNLSDDAPRV